MYVYEKLYHLMFNAATDAIRLLDAGDPQAARQLLIEAQQRAEDLYIDESDAPESPEA